MLVRCFFMACIVVLTYSASLFGETVEGFSEPYAQVELAVVEPGLLESLRVKKGDSVRPDQVVAKLNTLVLQKGLKIAEQKAVATGSVRAAEAERRLRKGRLDQIKLLRERGHATEHEYARAMADFDIAEARLTLAREERMLSQLEVERIEAQIERRIVRSPFEAVVSEIHKRQGESFSPGDTKVMTLVQLDKLKADFALTPEQAETLRVGTSLRVVFPSSSQETVGSVESISPVIDAKSGTIEVSIAIDNKKSNFRSGARCILDFEGNSETLEVSETTRQ